jgi:hypothetical protein
MLRVEHHLTSVRNSGSAHVAFILEHGLVEILKSKTLNFTECTHCTSDKTYYLVET